MFNFKFNNLFTKSNFRFTTLTGSFFIVVSPHLSLFSKIGLKNIAKNSIAFLTLTRLDVLNNKLPRHTYTVWLRACDACESAQWRQNYLLFCLDEYLFIAIRSNRRLIGSANKFLILIFKRVPVSGLFFRKKRISGMEFSTGRGARWLLVYVARQPRL